MRTLVHLSDLHFGGLDPALLDPLRACVEALMPDLIVVSGDLTQRARPAQFRAARDFLGGLPQPQIIVPGNHDVPLYAVVERLISPLGRYRSHFSLETEPVYVDDEIAVVGVNTARSLIFKGGRINASQVARARRIFRRAPREAVRIIVTHHPLHLPRGWKRGGAQAYGARGALNALGRYGVDLCLSGHVHRSHAGRAQENAREGGPLLVAAGTATSSRRRSETNRFNVLRVQHETIRIEHFGWDTDRARFACDAAHEFFRAGTGWQRLSAHAENSSQRR